MKFTSQKEGEMCNAKVTKIKRNERERQTTSYRKKLYIYDQQNSECSDKDFLRGRLCKLLVQDNANRFGLVSCRLHTNKISLTNVSLFLFS